MGLFQERSIDEALQAAVPPDQRRSPYTPNDVRRAYEEAVRLINDPATREVAPPAAPSENEKQERATGVVEETATGVMVRAPTVSTPPELELPRLATEGR